MRLSVYLRECAKEQGMENSGSIPERENNGGSRSVRRGKIFDHKPEPEADPDGDRGDQQEAEKGKTHDEPFRNDCDRLKIRI